MNKTNLFKMSKLLCGIVSVAMLTSSCSADTELNEKSNKAIAFDTFVDQVTKAPVKSLFDNGDTFGVFAYNTKESDYNSTTAPNFMFNQQVTKTGEDWVYAPMRYWPDGDGSINSNVAEKLTFFAYWPMVAADNGVSFVDGFEKESTADPKLVFDATHQSELLWAVEGSEVAGKGLPLYNKVKPEEKSGKLFFTFKHALCRVGFKFTLQDDILKEQSDATMVTIDTIQFGGDETGDFEKTQLVRTATLSLNNTVANVAEWSDPKNSFALKLTKDDLSNNGTFRHSAAPSDKEDVESKADDSADKAAEEKIVDAELSGEVTSKPTTYFMVIPQDFSQENKATSIRVVYTVTTFDDALAGGKSVITNSVIYPVKHNLINGKAYTYKFNIGLTSVKFDDPEIEDWSEQTIERTELTFDNVTISDWEEEPDFDINVGE